VSKKSVSVFVSSTFLDMESERDVLVTAVFPELRERLELLDIDLFDVDLRWGVPFTGLDGERVNSWDYCRKRIDEVEPFFICMIGERYGWRPPADEFNEADREACAGKSITELEVRHAALTQRPKHRCLFYLRDTPVPTDDTRTDPDVYARFVDRGPGNALQTLTQQIVESGQHVRTYAATWTGTGFSNLETFGERVVEDLWSAVLRDPRDPRYVSAEIWRAALDSDPATNAVYVDATEPIPVDVWHRIVEHARPAPVDPFDRQNLQMADFAGSLVQWFHGRVNELRALHALVNAADGRTLCAVLGASGAGKSAVLRAAGRAHAT
jgi:hypothetical protein